MCIDKPTSNMCTVFNLFQTMIINAVPKYICKLIKVNKNQMVDNSVLATTE